MSADFDQSRLPRRLRRLIESVGSPAEILDHSDLVPARTRRLDRIKGEAAERQPTAIDDAVYLHSILCQVGLPRRPVAERRYIKTNGSATLIVEAGSAVQRGRVVDHPVPYGTRPRLILIQIQTFAKANKTRTIPVGNSMRDWMKSLSLDVGGHEYSRFTKQLEALSACHMTLGFSRRGYDNNTKIDPIDSFETWFSRDGKQSSLWPGVIHLGEKFYQSLESFAVPLDPWALCQLRGSALELDSYTWLAHRLHRLEKTIKLTWEDLHAQFGGYGDVRSFRRFMRPALEAVWSVYRDAKIECDHHEGVTLRPSPPPVRKSQVGGPIIHSPSRADARPIGGLSESIGSLIHRGRE